MKLVAWVCVGRYAVDEPTAVHGRRSLRVVACHFMPPSSLLPSIGGGDGPAAGRSYDTAAVPRRPAAARFVRHVAPAWGLGAALRYARAPARKAAVSRRARRQRARACLEGARARLAVVVACGSACACARLYGRPRDCHTVCFHLMCTPVNARCWAWHAAQQRAKQSAPSAHWRFSTTRTGTKLRR